MYVEGQTRVKRLTRMCQVSKRQTLIIDFFPDFFTLSEKADILYKKAIQSKEKTYPHLGDHLACSTQTLSFSSHECNVVLQWKHFVASDRYTGRC